MAKRKRETGKKRESILVAAAAEFARVGYDRASMDVIAEAAGASKRTVYNHFAGKEALFHAVLDRFMSESHKLKQVRYASDQTLASQLGLFADAMWEPTRNRIWLGLMKVITTSPAVVGRVLARVEQQEDTLVTWLEAAADDGRLRVEDATFTAGVFWAMLSGAFMMPAIFAEPLKPREAKAMKTELVAMFLARHVPSK